MSKLNRACGSVVAGLALGAGCLHSASAEDVAKSKGEEKMKESSVRRVVCFGDSITGYRPGVPYYHMFIKWTDWMQFGLDQHFGEGKVEVINSGYAGDATFPMGDCPGGLSRVEADILKWKPEVAVILFGVNNFSMKGEREEVLKTIRDDVTTIVRQTKEAGIKVLLLQYAKKRTRDGVVTWSSFKDVNAVIAEIAKAEGVELLALEPIFEETAKTQPVEALFSEDGIHTNPYGEVIIARVVMKKVMEMMGK